MVQPLWQPWPILWPSVVKRCALVGAAGVGGWGTRCVLVPPTKVGKSSLHFDSVMGWLVREGVFSLSEFLLESCVYWSMTNLWWVFDFDLGHPFDYDFFRWRLKWMPWRRPRSAESKIHHSARAYGPAETGECVETTPNQEVLLSHFFSREAIWQKKVSWNWCCYIFSKALPSKFQAFHEFWDFDGVVCFSCLIQV